jgi:hypothetical protein
VRGFGVRIVLIVEPWISNCGFKNGRIGTGAWCEQEVLRNGINQEALDYRLIGCI